LHLKDNQIRQWIAMQDSGNVTVMFVTVCKRRPVLPLDKRVLSDNKTRWPKAPDFFFLRSSEHQADGRNALKAT
jgi:hypothetical protein